MLSLILISFAEERRAAHDAPPAYDPRVTYAKVQKRQLTGAAAQTHQLSSPEEEHIPKDSLTGQPRSDYSPGRQLTTTTRPSDDSFDSDINAPIYSTIAATHQHRPVATSDTEPVKERAMDRRSPSPGGTIKSVKFRDVPESQSVPVSQRNGAGTHRSGIEVVGQCSYGMGSVCRVVSANLIFSLLLFRPGCTAARHGRVGPCLRVAASRL